MQAAEIRNQDEAAIRGQIQEAKQEMFNLRFQLATGRGGNTSRISKLRREVARLETVLSERRAAARG